MKKILNIFVFLVMLLLASSAGNAILATGYSHSADYYTVSFDGEGDAVVRARLTIQNENQYAIENVSLEFPGRSIIFYDVLEESAADRTCVRYNEIPNCVQYDKYYNCERYDTTQVCDEWTYGPSVSQIEAPIEEVTSESTVLKLKLPTKIQKGDAGTIVIVYKVPKLAKNSLGAFSYAFSTVIDPNAKSIQTVRVAVNAEEGFYVKGTQAHINYRDDFFGSSQAESSSKMIANSDYYQGFTRQIVESEGYVKTAANLDPMESFVVKGEYSESYIRVHIMETAGLILLFAAIIGGLYFGGRKVISHLHEHKDKKANHSVYAVATLTSFAQAVLLTGLWFLSWFLLSNIQSWLYYSYAGPLWLAVMLLMGLLMIGLLFLPPVFVGIKKGFAAGIATFGLTIVWLVMIVLIAVVVLALLPFQPSYPVLY